VDVRRVLAYSCAAARDLHPLPLRRREPAMIMREPEFWKERNSDHQIYRPAARKSMTCLPLLVSI
jgi:hypothetical protein